MHSSRLLIVSNRLPVSATLHDGDVRLSAASGGLATGLRPWHEGADGKWIGWPGDVSRFSPEQRADLETQLAGRAIVPVHLTRDHIDRFYHGFSNRVIWPLFHYLADRVPEEETGWDAYRAANEAFADVVAREHRPGDAIWVHDYQLLLVPALLRQRLPEAKIGFFLHIPFPSSEVFRILPWRREILKGLLGADLIGFHTYAYLRHFVASLLHVDGVEAEIDRVRVGQRETRLGVFPMGVDAAHFSTLARTPEVIAEAASIRHDAGDRRIVLGIDRLDYTKGIPRRLEAVERVLTRTPGRCDTMRYIQLAVPSRGGVDSYQRFKRQVEERVGRINGAFGTLRSAPVHYVHRSVPPERVVALYCAADVMLVTPLRDGMNLVAKEFVASRVDDDGVLVLSEFAGASAELDGAIVVNPYDIDAVAEAMEDALAMPAADRRRRMQSLRRRVADYDVYAWATAFLAQLEDARPSGAVAVSSRREPTLEAALLETRQAAQIRLLLDYDGTLVPLAPSPELAAPDDEVLSLLAAVAAIPNLHVDIVSGRPRETLEAWLGALPVGLWAEHGFWHRRGAGDEWQAAATHGLDWMQRLMPILEQFTSNTPGSFIETKTASIAWHYRAAERHFGSRQAHELRMLLGDALSNQPVEVLEGKKVIEVRLRGVSKAVVAHHIDKAGVPETAVIAIGDDRTDEDLFRALPASSVTIMVGRRSSCARFRVDDHHAVRELLRGLKIDTTPVGAPGGWPRVPPRSQSSSPFRLH